MNIKFVQLCEHVSSHDGLLFVNGLGLTRIVTFKIPNDREIEVSRPDGRIEMAKGSLMSFMAVVGIAYTKSEISDPISLGFNIRESDGPELCRGNIQVKLPDSPNDFPAGWEFMSWFTFPLQLYPLRLGIHRFEATLNKKSPNGISFFVVQQD